MTYPLKNSYNGFFRALVIDEADPKFEGRVKVRIPDLMISDEDHVGKWKENGIWVRPGNTALGGRNKKDYEGAGERLKGVLSANQGQCLIPPSGSHVWVWFEKGNPSYGFYGNSAEYGQSTVLPENQVGKDPYHKWTLFKSAEGRAIVVSDDKTDERIEITGKKRKIENEPWGDLESIYEIDDNQTVFLIDERKNNEKILLKDYRGNFIKIVQDEKPGADEETEDEEETSESSSSESETEETENNEEQEDERINDQLHVYMKDDIHIKTEGNFYLTANDIHIKSFGSIYVTASENIFIHAHNELREQANSIDRFSTTYDNTTAEDINLNSKNHIGIKAATEFYSESIQIVRKALNISDTAHGTYAAEGGFAMGLTCGGPLNILGNPTTAQTAPIQLPLPGVVSEGMCTFDSDIANPTGDRNQEIKLIDGAPKFPNLDTPDHIKSTFDFGKIKIELSQGPDAHPESQPGDPYKKPTNNSKSDDQSSKSMNSGTGSSSSSSSTNTNGSGLSNNFGTSSASQSNTNNNEVTETGSNEFIESNKPTLEEEIEDTINEECNDIKDIEDVKEDFTKETTDFTNFCENAYEDGDNKYSISSKIDPGKDTLEDTIDNFFETENPNATDTFDIEPEEAADGILDGIFDAVTNVTDIISDLTVPATATVNSFIVDLMAEDGFYIVDLKHELPSICRGSFEDYYIYDHWTDYMDRYKNLTWDNIFDHLEDNEYQFYRRHINDGVKECLSRSCVVASDKLVSTIKDRAYDCDTKMIDVSKTDCDTLIKQYSNELSATLAQSVNENNEEIRRQIRENSQFEITEDINLVSNSDLKEAINDCKKEIDNYCIKVKNVDEYKESVNPKKVIEGYSDELKETCISTLDYKTLTREKVLELEDKIDNAVADQVIEDLSTLLAAASNDIKLQNFKNDINGYHSFSETLVSENKANFEELQQKVRDYCGEKYFQRLNEAIDLDSQIENVIDRLKDYRDGKLKKEFVRQSLDSIFDNIGIELQNESRYIIQTIVHMNDLLDIVNIFLTNADRYAEQFDQNVRSYWTDKIKEEVVNVQTERKQIVIDTFREARRKDNSFSEYDSNKNYEVPVNVGCGYEYLLFLKDKYRNTIIPLISKSGGNIVSFSIIRDIDKINETDEFLDNDSIQSYKLAFTTKTTIGKWWDNLRDILSQASIMNMTVCITLMDFSDMNNPFIKDVDESIRYRQENWSDDIQGEFFDRLFSVTKQYDCNIVYNIGYGSYESSIDTDHKKYPIYPTCSYLRKMIMKFAYKYKITSNMLGLTANRTQNLYYYNPYCEWYSYDDNERHNLKNCEMFSRDCIDGKFNDEADIVVYDKLNNINGGYSYSIISCSKYSLPVFSMNNLTTHLTPDMIVSDPNIMNQIFCKKSREAIRFFKTEDYFKTTGDLQFDENGEVEI